MICNPMAVVAAAAMAMAFRQVHFGGSAAAASIVHRHRRAVPTTTVSLAFCRCQPDTDAARHWNVRVLSPSLCLQQGRQAPTYLPVPVHL